LAAESNPGFRSTKNGFVFDCCGELCIVFEPHISTEKINDDKNFEKYKSAILKALEMGRSFTANFYHGNAKGFRFYAEQDGKTSLMGDELNIKEGKKIVLRVMAPNKCTIKLIHNGKKRAEQTGMDLIYDTSEPGAYRVECWINDKGWIFSNHIRVLN